jgi:hypothetical protein
MWILRFVVFDLQESAKYLVAKGYDEEAIKVLTHIAKKNGKTITLTVEDLQNVSGEKKTEVKFTSMELVKKAFTSFSLYVYYFFTGYIVLIHFCFVFDLQLPYHPAFPD